ncbi:putative NADPH-dependent methylglyoxal reductase GRP2 [Spathaspora sp. JA1]|nr:putative NADPH-dependent methylglyoxal reductase GRP2 [Spathaspora sp. JA1]
MTATTVFISGANGYIAQHIIKQLLAKKNYKVIGSVRSQSKGDDLVSLVNNDNFSYVVIPTISAKDAFYDVLKSHPEITVFLHAASPVTFEVEDVERDLLKPAIDGTVNALAAIKMYGPQIERVVVTSSGGSVFGFDKYFEADKIYDEESWNPITYEESKSTGPVNGYFGSKKFAELAALEFVKSQKPNFDLSIVTPVYNFGPQAYEVKNKSKLNVSAEVVNTVLKFKKDEVIPEFGNVFADVRDVAHAHIVAFESEESKGKRLLVATDNFTYDTIAYIINKHFPEVQIPKGDLSKNEAIYKQMVHKYDNSKTNKIIGSDFISLEKSIVDTVGQLLA